jgi:hypothetical protein
MLAGVRQETLWAVYFTDRSQVKNLLEHLLITVKIIIMVRLFFQPLDMLVEFSKYALPISMPNTHGLTALGRPDFLRLLTSTYLVVFWPSR